MTCSQIERSVVKLNQGQNRILWGGKNNDNSGIMDKENS